MSYFLLCIKKPNRNDDEKEWGHWETVYKYVELATHSISGVETPCDNVWLIPAKCGVGALAESVKKCRDEGQRYKVSFLQEEPDLCE
jgi:hypothetical protein